MRIPTHQIHNVLNAYARQLRDKNSQEGEGANAAPESPYSALAEKRGSIIDKITADIIRRLIEDGRIKTPLEAEHKARQTGAEGHRFSFCTYTEDKKKVVKTIEIKDSQFLIRNKV